MTPRTLAAASRSLGRLQSAATRLPAAPQLAPGAPSLLRLSRTASVAGSAAGGFSLPGTTPPNLRRLLVSPPLKQVPQQPSFGQAPRRSATRTLSIMAAQTPSGSQATGFEAGEEKARQDTQPGKEHKMAVKPETIPQHYKAAGKLEGKKALITGGDSGIGRAVAALFAMEGADVGITYVAGHEDKDAEDTLALLAEVSGGQRKATKYAADLGYDDQCKQVADAFLRDHGRIDILVNHAGEQHAVQKFEDLSPETVERTFRTNVYSQFFLTRHLLPSMPEGGSIINTASVNAYKGNKQLIDYTASKGANVAFTRALALNLASRNIRVNGVAPGPIWTPLISATFPEEKVAKFGEETPLGRAGHPSEVAPAYVFLASADASYITGQVIHPNGGMVVNA